MINAINDKLFAMDVRILYGFNVSVLYGCMGPCGNVVIPDGVMEIGVKAFKGRTSLTGVTVSEGVRFIDSFAFCGCSKLRSVVLPKNVIRISRSAFQDCISLESVTMHGNPDISKTAFKGCPEDFVLIATHTPLSDFSPANKPHAILGFAKLYQKNADMIKNIRADYLWYIQTQRKRLYSLAVKHEELIRLMLTEKMIPRKDIDAVLDTCGEYHNDAARAAVLEYANHR